MFCYLTILLTQVFRLPCPACGGVDGLALPAEPRLELVAWKSPRSDRFFEI